MGSRRRRPAVDRRVRAGGRGGWSGYTGPAGVLLESVGTERIVTALVVWSQLGIVGYLMGPLAGGVAAQEFGFAAIGLVPAIAAVPLVGTIARARPGPR